MPKRERLERPQASLLEDIEAEMAEEAALEVENVADLLKWKKYQAWLTIGIFACIVIFPLLSAPFMFIYRDIFAIGYTIGIAASALCAVGSFVIAIRKPDIYRIAPDGTVKPQKAAKYGFFFLWFTQGGLILVMLLLVGLIALIASLF